MKRVSLSFSDDEDLAVLTGALRLALDEWGEMAGDGEGEDGKVDAFWQNELSRAEKLDRRVERARHRLAR